MGGQVYIGIWGRRNSAGSSTKWPPSSLGIVWPLIVCGVYVAQASPGTIDGRRAPKAPIHKTVSVSAPPTSPKLSYDFFFDLHSSLLQPPVNPVYPFLAAESFKMAKVNNSESYP